MIRLVIVDDHELIREGVKKILRSSPELRVVGEAADLAQALGLVAQHQPDIVVLDASLPGHDGLAGLQVLLGHFPLQRVVMLSMYSEERFAVRALKAGAAAYISKTTAAEELVKAIRKVMAGGTYIGARLAELLANQACARGGGAPHEALTVRENEILALIGAGRQVKQVAAELGISVSSVNTYRSRIFRKMGLSSNAALIRYALQQGLVA
jgi:two-component system invasion response regulator UvrY